MSGAKRDQWAASIVAIPSQLLQASILLTEPLHVIVLFNLFTSQAVIMFSDLSTHY